MKPIFIRPTAPVHDVLAGRARAPRKQSRTIRKGGGSKSPAKARAKCTAVVETVERPPQTAARQRDCPDADVPQSASVSPTQPTTHPPTRAFGAQGSRKSPPHRK